jgi:putative transport protein
MSGATGNPAILSFANKLAPTERTDVAYAMIFPSMTVLKIVIVEIAAVVLGGR